jgi:hypothetical protein
VSFHREFLPKVRLLPCIGISFSGGREKGLELAAIKTFSAGQSIGGTQGRWLPIKPGGSYRRSEKRWPVTVLLDGGRRRRLNTERREWLDRRGICGRE